MGSRSPDPPPSTTLADEVVSIFEACRLVGLDLPDDIGSGRSSKVHCPFGEVMHSDHGAEPAMRIYPDTNSAWCFSCGYFYTPVRLVARAWDIDQKTAADRLLARVGYRAPSPQDVWDELTGGAEVQPEKAHLAQALKTYCKRICPQWTVRQYEDNIAVVFAGCLGLLDFVHNENDARNWLTGTKTAMANALSPVRDKGRRIRPDLDT